MPHYETNFSFLGLSGFPGIVHFWESLHTMNPDGWCTTVCTSKLRDIQTRDSIMPVLATPCGHWNRLGRGRNKSKHRDEMEIVFQERRLQTMQ